MTKMKIDEDKADYASLEDVIDLLVTMRKFYRYSQDENAKLFVNFPDKKGTLKRNSQVSHYFKSNKNLVCDAILGEMQKELLESIEQYTANITYILPPTDKENDDDE